MGGQPVVVFYPADGGGSDARSEPGDGLARRFGAEAAADLAAARGPARRDATVKPGDYPLLIFAPGAGLGSSDYRWLLAGLASRGAVIVGLDPQSSPSASERRVEELRDQMIRVARAALHDEGLARAGTITGITVAGHSIGGAAAAAALAGLPGARAANIDGDFLGVSNAPAKGPVLFISGGHPDEPARSERRRTGEWQVVANGMGRRLMLDDMRHLGATDAALLPPARRNRDLGPDPLAMHRAIGEALAAFLFEHA